MMTLKDFLFTLESKDDDGNWAYLDTDNDTFPEEYRSSFQVSSTLFANAFKNGDEDFINNSEIDRIVLKIKRINEYVDFNSYIDMNETLAKNLELLASITSGKSFPMLRVYLKKKDSTIE